MLDGPGRRAILKTARLPGPLHMSAALLALWASDDRASGLQCIAAGMRLMLLRRCDRATPGAARMTVAELMDALGQGERARQCFWYPLAIATLNEDPELASAGLLAEVFKRAFFSRRSDSAFVYSRVGLSDLYCTGAARDIERRGGVVALARSVETIELRDGRRDRAVSAARRQRVCSAANFIVAVPPQQLLQTPARGRRAPIHFFAPIARRCKARQSYAFMCGSIARSPTPPSSDSSAPLPNGCSTSGGFSSMHGERHPGYLSFVISGARKLVDESNEELLDNRDRRFARDDSRVAPGASVTQGARCSRRSMRRWRRIPTVDRIRPDDWRRRFANLFLAGDWVQTGLPATIESAVMSGRAAAAPSRSRFDAATA